MAVVNGEICMCSPGYSGPMYYVAGQPHCFRDYVERLCTQTQPQQSIKKDKICDKNQDCPDDSDEINCICDSQYQYACKNGRCIDGSWLCDGVVDCPLGDDEIYPQCDNCWPSQFQCSRPRFCIPSDRQCNGIADCLDSSDESGCASLTGSGSQLLTVTYNGISGYRVCWEGWNLAWFERICNIMGFGRAATSRAIPATGSFLSLTSVNPASNFLNSLTAKNCPSQQAVEMTCHATVCGVRTISGSSVGQYILNGQMALKGAWPWQVYISVIFVSGSETRTKICGGSLISNRWILTAAHCTIIPEEERDYFMGFAGLIKPQNIKVLLGALSVNDPSNVWLGVDRVYNHSDYDITSFTNDNDVGLIRLSQPVSFNDTIRPICLPAPDEDLRRLKTCVVTGFGWTLRGSTSDDLLQARMNILPDDECKRIRPPYNNETQICIGTDPSLGNNHCAGDSGGPLACQDSNGIWKLIGVNSFASGSTTDLGVPLRCPNSFNARVTTYLDWISSIESSADST